MSTTNILFLGGPWHGQFRQLNGRLQLEYNVFDPKTLLNDDAHMYELGHAPTDIRDMKRDIFRYKLQRFRFRGFDTDVYVYGDRNVVRDIFTLLQELSA